MLNLKNKTEREEFIKDYKNWTKDDGETKLGIWKSVSELGLDFYRYEFENGAELVVTEFQEYKTVYGNYESRGQTFVTEHKLCLILPENDDYFDASHTAGRVYHRSYTLNGCSLGTVVDYLTKNKLNI